MRGILLAGGNGTRLMPLTKQTNKHLLPVYDKQMILYPLQTLLDLGVKDILIITGGEFMGQFVDLLGSGSKFKCKFTYRIQDEAGGIAQALLMGKDFTHKQFVVILGDNVFEYAPKRPESCGIVTKKVDNASRFGVYTDGKIIEKPPITTPGQAVTGIYFYTPEVFDFIKDLKPSARGEMEITDVKNWCLENLPTEVIEYEGFWSDAGTFDSMTDCANWVKTQKKSEVKS